MRTRSTEPDGRISADERHNQGLDVGDLYREHAETVARWAQRLGGPLIDVEDAVHEVFLVVHRRGPRQRDDIPVTTWLYRVTELVVKHRRRKDRLRRWLSRGTEAVGRDLASTRPTPLEDIEARRRLATVYGILDALPEKYRTALILFELEGLSGEEIADLTGAKLSTVWVRLHRGRTAFFELAKRSELEQAGAA